MLREAKKPQLFDFLLQKENIFVGAVEASNRFGFAKHELDWVYEN